MTRNEKRALNDWRRQRGQEKAWDQLCGQDPFYERAKALARWYGCDTAEVHMARWLKARHSLRSPFQSRYDYQGTNLVRRRKWQTKIARKIGKGQMSKSQGRRESR